MRQTPDTRRPIFRARRGGFALLVTLTLLAFLVILLVGLATYTRVESAIAGNTQRQAQARQNALLALDVALAQLQQHAGPDQRVTATAESFGGADGTKHYTGVWDATSTGPDARTWLVSGNEKDPLTFTPAAPASATAELVGAATSGTPSDVVAPKVNIEAPGLPGKSGPATIGRYAWWVGDQGVKAPVAVADTTTEMLHEPFGDGAAQSEAGKRLRQQLAMGTPAVDDAANSIFDAQSVANASLVAASKVASSPQLALLKDTSGGTVVGRTRAQQNFHVWSANNFSVLANTKTGGLRRDLSIDPTLLGNAFAAWSDYAAHTETPSEAAGSAFPPLPALTAASTRRRHKMQSGADFSLGPTLGYFLLSFNIRTEGDVAAVRPLEARAFWKIALWNPYTSALVPEDLIAEVTGLPTVHFASTILVGAGVRIPLQTLFGSSDANTPVRIRLPWSLSTAGNASNEDRSSWLPGRVYNWRSIENTSGVVPSEGYDSRFYTRSYTATGEPNAGVIRAASVGGIAGNLPCWVDGEPSTITVKLFADRPTGRVQLGTFTAPPFSGFSTTPRPARQSSTQFVFFFRSPENLEKPNWIKVAGADPHQRSVSEAGFVYGPNGDSPATYGDDYEDSTFPERLLDRASNSRSYNEDVPVFELPRSPVLSLGMLQHFPVPNGGAFSIGNSWGSDALVNQIPAAEIFDRFYASGLVSGASPATSSGSWRLPSSLLITLPRNAATGLPVTLDDLRASPEAKSARFLLSQGAFNLNSVNPTAWMSVLRSVRYPAAESFNYVNGAFETGTSDEVASADAASVSASFFRFSQSAQETFKADPGYAASTVAPADGAADPTSNANTHLFRRGWKTLSSEQVSNLAGRIATSIRERQVVSGPIRSLEEWLRPPALSGSSLLEQAIADTTINKNDNGDTIEFSSQFLTQGDVMTALAPVLFPRSDTFVIRAYGEVVNPATNATEGRAWCEATVQRYPDYFDSSQPAETLPADLNLTNTTYGRRFKIVSFRWLTRSDI